MTTELKSSFGNYASNFADTVRTPYQRVLHTEFLEILYSKSFSLIKKQEWQNPLYSTSPKVLQIGTANFLTSKTYIDFIQGQNASTDIYIADFNRQPLQDCIDNGLDKQPNITFLQADSTELPFRTNSLDMIETDGLLQFLSPDEKKRALKEWFRVLKPEGIVTTRDWFIPDNPTSMDIQKDSARKLDMQMLLGVLPFSSTLQEIKTLMDSVGFQYTMVQDDLYDHLQHIVARKPK